MNPIHTRQTSVPTGQHGVSMIELLVAILIFAFGMLGLAGLQNRTLGFAQISLYRSQATALSDDILDRLRADRLNAKAGRWNTVLSNKADDISGATLTESDLKEWKTEVERLLPGGQASVSFDASTGMVTVDIRWSERGITQEKWSTVSAL